MQAAAPETQHESLDIAKSNVLGIQFSISTGAPPVVYEIVQASLEGANFIQLTFLLLNFLLYIFIIKTCKNVECFPFGVESFFELRFCKTSRGTKYDLLSTLETRVLLQRSSSRLLDCIYGSRICTVFIRKNWLCHGTPFAQPITRWCIKPS